MWDHDASYGAALQGLRYVDARHPGPDRRAPARWQKALYGLCAVGGRYAWARWEDYILDRSASTSVSPSTYPSRLGTEPLPDAWRMAQPSRPTRALARLTTLFETVHELAALASFLAFLVAGAHRTLLDRALRLRLAPAPTPTARMARSYEHLNRQLVWHATSEFLLFFLPLLGISRWRRWARRAWRRLRALGRAPEGGSQEEEEEDEEGEGDGQGEYAGLPERACAICVAGLPGGPEAAARGAADAAGRGGVVGSARTDVTNPYAAVPCGCVYCFACLALWLEAEEGEGFACLRCRARVTRCRPWDGDVLEEVEEGEAAEEPSPRAKAKMVSFADEVESPAENGVVETPSESADTDQE